MSIASALLSTFAVALAAPALHRLAPRVARTVLPIAPLLLSLYFCAFLPAIADGETITEHRPWVDHLGLSLSWRLDGLSLLFAILIAGMGTLVTLYAGSYLEGHPHLGRFYGLLFLFMASMLGVVLADNALVLFVFWELTSVSSYFLIGLDHERESARAAALQALLVTGSGGLALLAGVILLGQVAGTYELSEMSRVAPEHAGYVPIVLLVFAGALTKSAQFPFHFWLPRAMEAPTPVSAYLHAATMVKAGVYLLARLSPILSGSLLWSQTLVGVGTVTMLLGATLALVQTPFKRILAYSTVAALGTMVLLIGIGGAQATQALVIFLAAHALYKGALFLVAGAVDHATHERDVERLSGLRASLPATTVAAGLAALSMAGLPPLFGYVSKDLLYTTTLSASSSHILTAAALGSSALFFAVALTLGVRPFWSRAADTPVPSHDVPWPLWFAPLTLALLGLLLGVWPSAADALFQAATAAVTSEPAYAELRLWHGLGVPLVLSAATFGLGVALYRGRFAIRRGVLPLAPLARCGPAGGYALALSCLVFVARAQTRILQRGYLRGYLVIILSSTVLLVGYTLVARGGLPSLPAVGELRFYEGLVALLIVVAALSATRAKSRLASIISLGIVGYGVALIFILFGAPDLGITQLVVETLTVILLVAAFYHLPRFTELSSPRARARDVFVAASFGALMTTLVLLASEIHVEQPISRHYGEVSVSEAHGRNVVNVILTDFRALDTLGEITVLAAAAFGAFALLKLRTTEGPDR